MPHIRTQYNRRRRRQRRRQWYTHQPNIRFLTMDAPRPGINPHGIIRSMRLALLHTLIVAMAPGTIPAPGLLFVDTLSRQMRDRYRLQPQRDLLLRRDHERGEESRGEGAEAGETGADDGDVRFDDPRWWGSSQLRLWLEERGKRENIQPEIADAIPVKEVVLVKVLERKDQPEDADA